MPGLFPLRPRHRAHYRLRQILVEASSVVLGAIILIWSLMPVYNMFLVALDPGGHNEFTWDIWPPHPTLAAFVALWTEEVEDVRDIWPAFGNSIYIGVLVTALTVLVGSLASFAIGRMRLTRDWTLSSAALLTYVIPSSTLIIPFLRVMHSYGLSDNPWAVIAAEVTFATPYAILVLLYYAKLIPIELDDAARIDGASVVPGLSAHLSAADGPRTRRGGDLRTAVRVERLFLSVHAPHVGKAYHRRHGAGAVLRRRRRAMELHDGDLDPLFLAADRGLLRAAPLHGVGLDGRRYQGMMTLHERRPSGSDRVPV